MTVKNPNALVGLGGGLGGAQIVINIGKAFGWSVSTGWATLIAAGASYIVLFIGREGFDGVKNVLMHGTKGTTAPPPPTS